MKLLEFQIDWKTKLSQPFIKNLMITSPDLLTLLMGSIRLREIDCKNKPMKLNVIAKMNYNNVFFSLFNIRHKFIY